MISAKILFRRMLQDGVKLQSYTFDGYWKDVGTLESLWEANMDLLSEHPALDLERPRLADLFR